MTGSESGSLTLPVIDIQASVLAGVLTGSSGVSSGSLTLPSSSIQPVVSAGTLSDSHDAWWYLTTCADRTADKVWEKVIDAGYTAEEILKIMAAVLAGESSGAGTGTVTFKSIDGIKDRVIADVDGTGNRTAVVLDGE